MKIQPRTLQGFRDFLPAAMIPREWLMETARDVYRSYGFNPIDTPTLEYLEILQGKGSEETDRQLYQFEDNGGRKVGMRFDLTVPLARFAAQHIGELGTPFKRYHIAPVWRGERPQRGRYREFMQCDFDTIGTLSPVADIETVLVIHDLLQAIEVGEFTIRLNHRQVLNGLLESLQLQSRSVNVLRALDKLPKVGPQVVLEELRESDIDEARGQRIIEFAQLQGTDETLFQQLEQSVDGSDTGLAGVARLKEVFQGVLAAGVPRARLEVDISIARGLDYYTGTIVETFLQDLPAIGSVCSGGRYDNLAELYSTQQLPGIGASLGLDRLLAAPEELKRLPTASTAAEVFLAYFDAEKRDDYLSLAARLRSAGLKVEFYPEAKKLGQQLKYASERGFPVALIVGEAEFVAGTCQVKDLKRRSSQEVALGTDVREVVSAVESILGRPQ